MKNGIFRLGSSARTTDLTTGDVRKSIINFAVPVMIGNLFQQLYNMVDTAVVGRGTGADALAAVGTSSPVTQLILGLMIGLASGMSIVIAQYFGSGDKAKTRAAVTNGIYLISIVSVLVTAVGIIACKPLFRLINTPEEILDDAARYSIIIFAGTVAQAAYNYEAGILQAFGNSITPLLFLILTSFLNVGLDLLFVLGFKWGVDGAGIATVISQLISAVLCFLYMKKNVPELKFTKEDWRWDGSIAAQHLRTGIPMAFFSSLLAVSFLVLQSALNSLGSADVAAYTAGSKMDTLVYQVLGAFGTAISTFAAQNYGKNNMSRVREGVRKCIWLTIIISVVMTGFTYFFGRYFMLLFVGSDETEILRSGLQYMRTTSLFYCILGVNYVYRFTLMGVGKTAVPMLVGVSEILTRMAVTYLLVYRIGFTGMTLASPACWFTSTLLCVLCYRPMMRGAARKLAEGK